jgi:hypothetical protein
MTSRTAAATLLLVSSLALAGCDLLSGGSSADTTMRNVEILPGTASDEMITLDQASGDGTAIDTSVAVGPTAPADADEDAEEGEAPAADEGAAADSAGGSEADDLVIRPPAGGAEPDAPAKK